MEKKKSKRPCRERRRQQRRIVASCLRLLTAQSSNLPEGRVKTHRNVVEIINYNVSMHFVMQLDNGAATRITSTKKKGTLTNYPQLVRHYEWTNWHSVILFP